MTPEEATEVVRHYIGDAKEIMLRRYEVALREIARLRWWQVGKARRIAWKVLGIKSLWRGK